MVIYKITNKINDKKYIGQTVNYEERIRHHKQVPFRPNSKEKHKPLYKAIKKYGLDNFSFEIIDYADNMEELNEKEIYWINFYDSRVDNGGGYNLDLGGKNGLKSEFTKNKIREAQLGDKCWNYGMRGSASHNAKRVKNITTGQEYDSLVECAITEFGDRKYMKQISSICNPTSNKKTFRGNEYRLINKDGSITHFDKACVNTKVFQKVRVHERISNMIFDSISETSKHFGVSDSFVRDRIYGRIKNDKYKDLYDFAKA